MDGNTDDAFTVNSSGVVTTTKKLDREAKSSYLLTVRNELYQVLAFQEQIINKVSVRVQTFSVQHSDSNNFNVNLLLLNIFMFS